MQRVRIGLMGLAVVFLLVLLAAAFFGVAGGGSDLQRADDSIGLNPASGNLSADPDPKEPLAELGVAPGGLGETGDSSPGADPGVAPAR